jgi:hypothetical protein
LLDLDEHMCEASGGSMMRDDLIEFIRDEMTHKADLDRVFGNPPKPWSAFSIKELCEVAVASALDPAECEIMSRADLIRWIKTGERALACNARGFYCDFDGLCAVAEVLSEGAQDCDGLSLPELKEWVDVHHRAKLCMGKMLMTDCTREEVCALAVTNGLAPSDCRSKTSDDLEEFVVKKRWSGSGKRCRGWILVSVRS